MNSLAIVAIEAQKLHGYAQPLSEVSNTGEYKVEQNSVDGLVYITENGGAWTPLVGGGGGGSLDAAYLIGNVIGATNAAGAVVINSTRTSGNILEISQFSLAVGPLTGVAIDMSAAGTVGSPSTFDIPAITIVGARSSVAKTTGAALVQISSAYRNATALSVRLKNKQALAGSAVVIGWDATNYEGAVANTTLTGTTHVLTIDGQTNVTAGAQEFVGVRLLIPASSNSSTNAFLTDSVQQAGVAHYTSITPSTLTGSITGSSIRFDPAGGLSNPVVGYSVDMPASSSSVTRAFNVSTVQTAGSLFHGAFASGGATLTGTTYGVYCNLSNNVSPLGFATIAGYFSIPNTTRGDVSLEAALVISNLSRTFKSVHVSQALTVGQAMRIDYGTAVTQTGACYMMVLDGVSGFTPSADTYTGLFVGVPATTRAETANEGGVLIRSQATRQRVVETRIRNTGGTGIALSYDSSVTTSATMTMMNISPGLDTAVTLALGAALNGLTVDCTSRINAAGNQIAGLNVFVNGNGSNAATSSYCATFDYRNPAGTVAGNGIVNIEVGGTTTLSGPLTGLEVDLSTNVTPGANAVIGANITIPASSSASTRGMSISSTQTGAASVGIETTMLPGSSSTVIGHKITMGANCSSYGIDLTRGQFSVSQVLAVAPALRVLHYENLGVLQTYADGIVANFSFSGSGAFSGTESATMVVVANDRGSDSAWTTTGDLLKIIDTRFMASGAGVARVSSGNALNIQVTPNNQVSNNTWTVSGAIANLNYAPTASGGTPTFTETITGLKVTMTPYSANAVVGVSINMSNASAQGAALTIAHSGTNANQLVFTSAADGTGSHIYGPTTGTLAIRAGIRADAGTGRGIDIFARAGVTTGAGGTVSIGAGNGTGTDQNGGDISLQTGAKTGTGVKGHVDFVNDAIALGGGAAATMGTIGGSGPATAAQNQWLEVKVGTNVRWIPVWA